MALLMIFYSITRWPIEALRADERALLLGMTSAQIISVVLVGLGLAAWISLRFSPFTQSNPARLPDKVIWE
jgi:prolipoprotein diacylglyceryltransferase